MQGPEQQYTNDVQNKFGYYAAWEPNVPIAIGDIGVLHDNVFIRIKSLKDVGIPFDIINGTSKSNIEYSSNGSVSISTKLAGTTPVLGSVLTNADLGITVEFSSANSTYFKLANVVSNLMANTDSVGNQIIDHYKNGDNWAKEWVVVTEVNVAESGSIIISNSSNGKLELKANANITASKVDIADASFDFSEQFFRGLDTKIICQSNLTPLFRIMGIQHKGFLGLGKPVFRSEMDAMIQVTPFSAKNEYKDMLYFGAINPITTKIKK